MINRNIYLNRLLKFKDKDVIKVVTGIRRCGKSSLLKLLIEHLLANGVNEKNIIEINFESLAFEHLQNYKALYDYVKSKIIPGKKTYLILDEIQIVHSWEKAINSFAVDFDIDIYITGSNAYLLSSELSTYLSGRYVEIKLLPLSFKEFLDFAKLDGSVSMEQAFELYLKYGGMPSIFDFNLDELSINNMLEGIYSTVILKDIVGRNNLNDISLLNRLVLFLADSIGSTTSPNSIGKYLNSELSNKKSVASKTVENYLTLLQNSFVFYSIGRYDIKGKQYLKTLGKNYIVDIGIRNMLLGYRDVDRGHVLENVVYFELLRRGYRLSIGKVNNTEIDFVAEKPNEKVYFQVTETLAGDETKQRELRPLKAINDNYKKVVLSMDRSFVESYDGIEIVNIIDFLLDASNVE